MKCIPTHSFAYGARMDGAPLWFGIGPALDTRRTAQYSGITGRIEARASPSAGKGFDDPILHSRDVHVLLSVLLRRAGVFAGLDSESESIPQRPTRQTARWVFRFRAQARPSPGYPVRFDRESAAQCRRTYVMERRAAE
jgi:hypothetical protein